MSSSISIDANEAKQTPPPSPPADDGEDRISGLCDDVLVRILGSADIDARELVRTSVLSRRWRGLWARVPSLRFVSPCLDNLEPAAAGDVVGRYLAFVNGVLEQRARLEATTSIESLAIPVVMLSESLRGHRQQLQAPAVEAAEAWVRYAVQRHVRCFELELRLPFDPIPDDLDIDVLRQELQELKKKLLDSIDNPPDDDEEEQAEADDDQQEEDDDEEESPDEGNSDDDDDDEEEDKPIMDLDDLPSSTKLETLKLCLIRVRVRLPSTAVFASLKSLTLEFIDLAPGSGHLLARLISSSACCPSLRRLRMARICWKRAGTRDLVVDAGELLQLSVVGMDGMRSLELRTRSLACLEITECDDLRSLTVSAAPALQVLTFQHNFHSVAVHGEFPRLWCLKIHLVTHLYNDDDINDTCVCLVKRCSSSATSLVAYLDVPSEIERRVDLIKDKIPKLPNVTSLAVNIHPIVERHSFGDGVAGLLTRFNNLEYLSLKLDDFGFAKRDEYYSVDADRDLVFTCNHADNWESNSSHISLGSLREAGFIGMTGSGCELRFLQMLLASATGLERVIVSFSLNYNLEDNRMHQFVHTLLGDGTWTAVYEDDCDPFYQWTPCSA